LTTNILTRNVDVVKHIFKIHEDEKRVCSMTGQEVKQLIISAGVKCWQVAERWGIADCNFSRRLRKPFDEKEVERVKSIIAEIKAQK